MRKRIYIDTEFSGFGTLDLLSIGCVADSGEEFYAEAGTIRLDRCNAFVRATVLPLLCRDPAIVCEQPEMARRLRAYLAQFETPLEICFDFKGDWVLLRQILEVDGQPLPHNIRKRNVLGGAVQRLAMDELFEATGWPAHHALNDARVLMRVCEESEAFLSSSAFERLLAQDDGAAAKRHLAAGRPIYYADERYPGELVKKFPDGRKQLVAVNDRGKFRIIRHLD